MIHNIYLREGERPERTWEGGVAERCTNASLFIDLREGPGNGHLSWSRNDTAVREPPRERVNPVQTPLGTLSDEPVAV